MVDVIIINLFFLIMMLGMIIYDKKMEKYYKKHCTLKVEAHIVERKRISRRGFTLPDYWFSPIFAVDIDGTEHLIVEEKPVWTDSVLNDLSGTERFLIADKEPTWIDRPLEEYPHLMLWVNPQNPKQFLYDDERFVRAMSRQKKASYIAVGFVWMLMTALDFAFR